MSRAAILAGALISVAACSPAAAGSWGVGVGVGFGGPAYYPPPRFYYGPPPGYVYAEPPVVYVPAPAVRSSFSPDAVFDALERSGYREFSPMAFRRGVYKLNAINRRGDLVALEVSALDGRVEREFLLKRGHSASKARAPLPRPVPAVPPAAPSSGNLTEANPLVVY